MSQPIPETVQTQIRDFLILEVNDTKKFPIFYKNIYLRKNYSLQNIDWNEFFSRLHLLYDYIDTNNLLKVPSALIPNNKIYRAMNSKYYDNKTKSLVQYPEKLGDFQPVWFALDESNALGYYKKQVSNSSQSLIAYTLRDETPTNIHIRLLDLDGDLIPECNVPVSDDGENLPIFNIKQLNHQLIDKLFSVIDWLCHIKDKDLYATFGKYSSILDRHMSGTRSSNYIPDRIIVIEFMIVFKMIEMIYNNLHNNEPIIVLGYHHSNISKINPFIPLKSQKMTDCHWFDGEITINQDYFKKGLMENIVDKYDIYTPRSRKRKLSQGGRKHTRKTHRRRKKKPQENELAEVHWVL